MNDDDQQVPITWSFDPALVPQSSWINAGDRYELRDADGVLVAEGVVSEESAQRGYMQLPSLAPEGVYRFRIGSPAQAVEWADADEFGEEEAAPSAGSLAEFLLARIAEDEELLEREGRVYGGDGEVWTTTAHARAAAEFEAKRQIVADLEEAGRDASGRYEEGYGLTTAIQHLAAVYADHPDYREEWRP